MSRPGFEDWLEELGCEVGLSPEELVNTYGDMTRDQFESGLSVSDAALELYEEDEQLENE